MSTICHDARRLGLALAAIALVGCGDQAAISSPETLPRAALTANVARVIVRPPKDTINAIGFTAQLTAEARNASGALITGVTFAWSSANPAIAKVDQTGKVTTTGVGSVNIIASAGGRADTSAILSRQIVATVTVSPPSAYVGYGAKLQLTATARDSAGVVKPNASFTWSSSNAQVATVTSSGLVTGVSAGTATIRARTPNGRVGTAKITVGNVAPPPGGTTGVWKLVHAGSNHACGITSTGSAQCWGQGGSGQLGVGIVTGSATPLKVAGGHSFTTLWAGDRSNCAVTTAGAAWCWGMDFFGSAGNGRDPGNFCHPHPDEACDNGPEHLVPVRVLGTQTWTQVTSGFHHSCGITAANEAWCWGANPNGPLGTSATTGLTGLCTDFVTWFPCSDAPVRVVGGHAFKQIAAGFWHTCGVTTAGKAYCWGTNIKGQLGDGTNTERRTPSPVAGNLTFASVSAMFEHTCGVTTTGEGYCWGANQFGRLGDGTEDHANVPRRVLNVPPLKEITAGGYHSCAVSTTNAAYCWGWNNFGYLGNGNTTMSLTAVPVSGGHAWRMVEAGYQFTCGVTTAGDAYCWGFNGSGELGDGTFTHRFVPTRVRAPQP